MYLWACSKIQISYHLPLNFLIISKDLQQWIHKLPHVTDGCHIFEVSQQGLARMTNLIQEAEQKNKLNKKTKSKMIFNTN